MRELRIGEQQVRVRATPLALLFYKQEFKRDLLGDLIRMVKMIKPGANSQTDGLDAIDLDNYDSIVVLQLIWAMAKADAFGNRSFPSFMEWLNSLEGYDMADQDLIREAMEEATNGFFRSGVKGAAK